MAKYQITIDDSIAKEIEKHAKLKGTTFAEAVESLAVTAVGRLTAARRWAKKNAKPKKAKVAKAPKAVKKAKVAKAPKAKVAKAPKAAQPAPTPAPTGFAPKVEAPAAPTPQ